MIYVTFHGQSIIIDGFPKIDDCLAVGYLNVRYVQVNAAAQYRCEKTGRRAVVCLPDKRKYGRTADCITAVPPQRKLT